MRRQLPYLQDMADDVADEENEEDSGPPVLNSVNNALRVLDYLVEEGQGGVSEMGRQLGLSPGTVHRLVSTLVQSGFAAQNGDTRKYLPGSRILELANLMRSRTNFAGLAHVHLGRLAERSNETVNLGVMRGDDIVYVDRVLSRRPVAVEVKIGSRVPAYCTALGKAILGFSPEETRESYLRKLQQLGESDTEHLVPTVAGLRKELDEVAAAGYAEDRGEYSPDICCIAAPVLNSNGTAVAAVSISGPASRFSARRDVMVPFVEIVGRELTLLVHELGDDSPPL